MEIGTLVRTTNLRNPRRQRFKRRLRRRSECPASQIITCKLDNKRKGRALSRLEEFPNYEQERSWADVADDLDEDEEEREGKDADVAGDRIFTRDQSKGSF